MFLEGSENIGQWNKTAVYIQAFLTASAQLQSCSLKPGYLRCPIYFFHFPGRVAFLTTGDSRQCLFPGPQAL